MKIFLSSKILGLAGFMFLLPAIGSASVVTWSLAILQSGGTTGIGAASVSFADIVIGGTPVVDVITETYNYTGGVGTLSFKAGTGNLTYGFVAGQTFLTITENGSNLLPMTSAAAVNLFQNVTSIVFNDATFAAALGQTATSFTTSSAINALISGTPNFSVTSTSGSVSSAISNMSVNTATPEPSTFAMLGIALFAGLGVSLRKKLSVLRIQR
jgi:hypothetical protein